jgi:hypothetical protein
MHLFNPTPFPLDKRFVTVLFGLVLIYQTTSLVLASGTNVGNLSPEGTNWFVQRDAEGRIRTSILVIDDYQVENKARLMGFIGHTNVVIREQVCLVGVIGHSNIIAYKPLPSQAFDAQIFDSEGMPVVKTSIGKSIGKPLEADLELLDPSHHTIMNYLRDERTLRFDLGVEERVGQFTILKSFRIKNAGEYRLRVQAKLFFKDTNGVFQPFTLPPVEEPIKISENEIK